MSRDLSEPEVACSVLAGCGIQFVRTNTYLTTINARTRTVQLRMRRNWGDQVPDHQTSERMRRIGQRDTAPEIKVRALLHRLGYRFRVHNDTLPGRPDIANRRQGWAVFVHGCFWHAHANCRRATTPFSNSSHWQEKFKRTAQRDREAQIALHFLGYRVETIWECELADIPTVTRRLCTAISR
jgi:DNA mismatch endonuclease (patch repair protein)